MMDCMPGDLALDVRGDTAKTTLRENLTGVQAGPLLKDMTGNNIVKRIVFKRQGSTGNAIYRRFCKTIGGIRKKLCKQPLSTTDIQDREFTA